MSISANLIESVTERNIQTIRDCLAASIVFDPTLTGDFPEGLDYCCKHGVDESSIYEKHDGRSLDRAETNNSFSELCAELGTNFSRERVEAIRKLGRKLHSVSVTLEAQGQSKQYDSACAKEGGTLQLFAFAVIGALAGGVAGVFLLRKVLIGAIVGGVAGGTVGGMLGKRTHSDTSR